ncbi:MAG: hypothetical protein ACT4QC_06055 [Planctomycetaceae bacterium]
MYKALVFKELRETAWAGAIALVVVGVYVSDATLYGPRDHVPFLRDQWNDLVLGVSCYLAIGLGLWQTLGESMRGTWPFLRHRPMRGSSLVLTKILAGLVVLLMAVGVPTGIYPLWAAIPGTHASPLELWMVLPTLWIWFLSTTVYLASFLVGIREVRWHGTRLWPLAAAGVLVFFVAQGVVRPDPLVTAVCDGVYLAAIVSTDNGNATTPHWLKSLGALCLALVLSIVPVIGTVIAIVTTVEFFNERAAQSLRAAWPVIGAVSALGAFLAFLTDRRRRKYALPRSYAWLVFVFLLGLPGFVGYLLHRRWPVRHLAPPPVPTGVEIFA